MKKILLALGVVGLGSVLSAPVMAQTYASGSSTIVLMNGASQSVGAEISLPGGTYFTGSGSNGEVTVTPDLYDTSTLLSTNTQSIDNLEVNPGPPESITTLGSGSSATFTAAAAAALDIASDLANAGTNFNLEQVVSIIRAGAGVNGLD